MPSATNITVVPSTERPYSPGDSRRAIITVVAKPITVTKYRPADAHKKARLNPGIRHPFSSVLYRACRHLGACRCNGVIEDADRSPRLSWLRVSRNSRKGQASPETSLRPGRRLRRSLVASQTKPERRARLRVLDQGQAADGPREATW